MRPPSPAPMIQLLHLSKHFHVAGRNIIANNDVCLTVQTGSIHALAGENGAGKSTLLKMIFGLETPTQGQVFFKGVERKTPEWNPFRAFQEGLGMVHQHFMLAGPETVLDNICLGIEKKRAGPWGALGFRSRKSEIAEITELMNETGLHVNLSRPVNALSVGEQSRVEILKVLYRKADCIILDEPTAVLTPQEVQKFLTMLQKLKSLGKTIVLVTHKLGEILKVADEVTVLRRGEVAAHNDACDLNIDALSELIVGRSLKGAVEKDLTIQASASFSDGSPVRTIPFGNLVLRRGEVLGVAGVEGNGQDEMIASFCGNLKNTRKEPIAIIAPDRHRQSCILGMTARDNLRLGRLQALSRSWASLPDQSPKWNEMFQQNDVRPPELDLQFKSFSGGNQQKIVIARELFAAEPSPHFIMAAHPTRGVDLGAIELIHRNFLKMKSQGAGILLISSELSELMALSDRIIVLYRNNVVAKFSGPRYDEAAIGQAMLTGVQT